MRADQRRALRQRFDFRCGYCGVSEANTGAELTVDHFQPLSRGGADVEENWVWCCHACNEFKGNYWQPGSAKGVLHPLRDDLKVHFRERADGHLEALTETGAFHINRLRLNRAALVEHRQELRALESAQAIQTSLLFKLNAMEAQVQSLTERLERLERGDSFGD